MSQPSKSHKTRTFNRYWCLVSLTLGVPGSSPDLVTVNKSLNLALSFVCPFCLRYIRACVFPSFISYCKHLVSCKLDFGFDSEVSIPECVNIPSRNIFHNAQEIRDYISSEIIFSLLFWEYKELSCNCL